MTVVRAIRVLWHRARLGTDPGDPRPGEEYAHLRGRALRRAVRKGLANPDGSTRTQRD